MSRHLHNSEVEWRPIRSDEAELAYAVHRAAITGMPDELVRADMLTHFMDHTKQDGIIFGGFVKAQGMIAYGVIGLASKTVDHMASVLGVADHDRARFALLDGAATLASWRGKGLHRELIWTRLAHVRALGYTLIGVTVAPGNLASLRGLLQEHFQISGFAELYDGHSRLILKLDALAVPARWQLLRKIKADDALAHQMALSAGLSGFAFSIVADGSLMVHYGCQSDSLLA